MKIEVYEKGERVGDSTFTQRTYAITEEGNILTKTSAFGLGEIPELFDRYWMAYARKKELEND